MKDSITYVGLDVHKQSINVAMLLPGRSDAVSWQVENEESSLPSHGGSNSQAD